MAADVRSASLSQAFTAGTADTVVGAAGGTPALTYAAAAGAAHVLGAVIWSISAAPTGGSVVLTAGTASAPICQWDVTAAGPGFMPFNPALRSAPGSALVVTGYPGGTANVVKLSASHWTES